MRVLPEMTDLSLLIVAGAKLFHKKYKDSFCGLLIKRRGAMECLREY